MIADNVDPYSQDPEDQQQLERAKEWEESMIEFLKEWEKDAENSRYMKIGFFTERSVEDELERQTEGDVTTIVISYIVMFIYISFALGRVDKPSRLLVKDHFDNTYLTPS